MHSAYSQKFLQKRKLLLVLPLLTLPFITLLFYLMGGGSAAASGGQGAQNGGLNLELPDATLPGAEKADKLSFYNQLREDSLRLHQEMAADPYFSSRPDSSRELFGWGLPAEEVSLAGARSLPPGATAAGVATAAEEKIHRRLSALQQLVQEPRAVDSGYSVPKPPGRKPLEERARTQPPLPAFGGLGNDDPELSQLDGMLDKILEIQHPQRVKGRLGAETAIPATPVLPVRGVGSAGAISYLGDSEGTSPQSGPGFWGASLSGDVPQQANAMAAVVHGRQTAAEGATVKIRLLEEVRIGGQLLPKGSFLYGRVSMDGERLRIAIASVRLGNSILPVALQAYDLDGLPGLYVPASPSREVARRSADQHLQSLQGVSLDPSLKAQAATAGISTLKSLLSGKVRQPRVTLSDGYRLLLKDESSRHP